MCRCEPITDYQRVYAVCVAVRRRVANLHKSSICAYGSLCACACRWCSAGGARWLFNGCPAAVQRAQRLSGASGASGVRVGHAGESWPELVVLRRSSDGARVASHLILAIRWRKTSHDFDFWPLFSIRAQDDTPKCRFAQKMPVRGYFTRLNVARLVFWSEKRSRATKRREKTQKKTQEWRLFGNRVGCGRAGRGSVGIRKCTTHPRDRKFRPDLHARFDAVDHLPCGFGGAE